MDFVFAIIIGGIAGVIADRLMSANNSLVLNIILGVVGAVLLNFVFDMVFGLWGVRQLVSGVLGASALIWGFREMQKRR